MEFRYSHFDAERASREELLEQLEKLFGELLLRTAGDAQEAFRWLEQIGRRHGIFEQRLSVDEVREHLLEQRTVALDGGGALRVTPRGEQMLRRDSLERLFGALQGGPAGDHRTQSEGGGGERLPETRAWNYGDPMSLLDGAGTLREAMRRAGIDDFSVEEADLRVHEVEQLSMCATVLLVDVSHSMVLYGEDRITPARRLALALAELIRTRFPKDSLDVVLFGDTAERVPLEQLPYLDVGPFHTNTRAGLRMAQEILRRKRHGNRQIVMVTDGKPSCLTERDGSLYKNPFGLDERVVNKTLDEAAACRRLGIPVTTFMLTADPVLVEFVDRFTEVNRGRAFHVGADRLGAMVLKDFVRNRQRRVR